MHVFHFKIYISAFFSIIAMNLTPYSPAVTWCAKFAAYPTFGTKGVNVWVFGQVAVTALYPNGLTIFKFYEPANFSNFWRQKSQVKIIIILTITKRFLRIS